MAIKIKKKKLSEEEIAEERRRRCKVLLWAYAYERQSTSIVDDFHFDRVCEEIDTSIETGHKVMDAWFKENLHPCTGSWVGELPKEEYKRLQDLFHMLYETNENTCEADPKPGTPEEGLL